MTAEDKIHWGLLLVLGTVAGSVFLGRPPSDHARLESLPPRAPASDAPEQASREELDAAIARLKNWVEESHRVARTPLERSLALHGLGQAGLDPKQPTRELLLLLSPDSELGPGSNRGAHGAAALAPASQRDAARPSAEDEPIPALAILLEGGVRLDRELPFPSGTLSLKQLVEDAIQGLEPRAEPSGWELELLSLASLGGLNQHRERLAYLAQAALTRLDRGSRGAVARAGGGELDAETLRDMAAIWRTQASELGRPAYELHLAVAVFRAVAVLAEPELEIQARRHLHTLSFRYPTERALYQYLLATSVESMERARIRLDAIEYFGRLEQALYGAHLAFRRKERPEPDDRIATVMRQAAHDLLEHHEQLERAAVFEVRPEASADRTALLRAAVHALRGLRTARVALPKP